MIDAAALLGTLFAGTLAAARMLSLRDRMRAWQKSARRRERLAERFRVEAESFERQMEETALELESARAAADEMEAALQEIESSITDLRSRPKRRAIVFDLQTLKSPHLHVVRVSHPDFRAIAHGRSGDDPLVKIWRDGRDFLVAAADDQAARKRVGARFPSGMGYEVEEVRSFTETHDSVDRGKAA